MRAGQPPERGPRRQGAAVGGGAARRQREHPRAARVSEARRHGGRLGLPLRARAALQRQAHPAAARARARRLLFDQRDGLHPRQPSRLRRMGRAGLVVGGPAAVLPQGRGQRARRVPLAWRRRPAARERRALGQPDLAGFRGGGRAGGTRTQRRLQRRRAGRRRALPGHAARRDAREHRGCLPAPGDASARTSR